MASVVWPVRFSQRVPQLPADWFVAPDGDLRRDSRRHARLSLGECSRTSHPPDEGEVRLGRPAWASVRECPLSDLRIGLRSSGPRSVIRWAGQHHEVSIGIA